MCLMTSSEWTGLQLSQLLNRVILIKQGIFQIEGLDKQIYLSEMWLNENELSLISGLDN